MIENKIFLKDLQKHFNIEKVNDNELILKAGFAEPIKIQIPFIFDADIAKICGMLLDGYIDKDLKNAAFSQKKDKSKIDEFKQIIYDRFNFKCKVHMTSNETPAVSCSKTLAYFFYHIIDLNKCCENTRIPNWIWNSPEYIIKEYLRYAFAMEGSVTDPTKGRKEVRFHSCDEQFIKEMKELLKKKFSITSNIHEYFIKNYGWKYYISITNKENLLKFAKIGFALESHQKRLQGVIDDYKPTAAEITLVSLLKFDKNKFHIKDINKNFPYLHKRAIHERIRNLFKNEYVNLCKDGYKLTEKGKRKADSLKDKIQIIPVRTKPRENEEKILQYIAHNSFNSISQISRDLQIKNGTVKDTLDRLEKKGKIKLARRDKFQRKIWKIKNGWG